MRRTAIYAMSKTDAKPTNAKISLDPQCPPEAVCVVADVMLDRTTVLYLLSSYLMRWFSLRPRGIAAFHNTGS